MSHRDLKENPGGIYFFGNKSQTSLHPGKCGHSLCQTESILTLAKPLQVGKKLWEHAQVQFKTSLLIDCSASCKITSLRENNHKNTYYYIFFWFGVVLFCLQSCECICQTAKWKWSGDERVPFFLFWYDKATSGGLGVVFAPDVTSAFGPRSFHVLYAVRLIEVTHAADRANTWWSFHPKITVTSLQLTTCPINYWQFWERKPRTWVA